MMADGGEKPREDAGRIDLTLQRGAPVRAKRFFKEAQVAGHGADFEIRLDGRLARTPARHPLCLPSRAAAEAVAAEWNALGDVLDPASMPMTRIVNAALDGVSSHQGAVEVEVANYIGSDLLLYRAGEPDQLVDAEARAWDPILDWCGDTFGARFFLVQGVMHVEQPPETCSTMRQVIALSVGQGEEAALRLAALHVMTTLTGSALLALAVLHGRLTAEEAWSAAHVGETFQESRWGQDEEALQRRQARRREMQAAARLAALV